MKQKYLFLLFVLTSFSTIAQTVNPALNIWNDITCDTLIIDNDTFVFGGSTITANTIQFSAGGSHILSLVGSSKINACNIIFTEELQRIYFSNGNGAEVNYTCEEYTTDASKIVDTSVLSLEEYIKSTYKFDGKIINFTKQTKGDIYDLTGKKLLQFDASELDLRHLKGILIIKLENYSFKVFRE